LTTGTTATVDDDIIIVDNADEQNVILPVPTDIVGKIVWVKAITGSVLVKTTMGLSHPTLTTIAAGLSAMVVATADSGWVVLTQQTA